MVLHPYCRSTTSNIKYHKELEGHTPWIWDIRLRFLKAPQSFITAQYGAQKARVVVRPHLFPPKLLKRSVSCCWWLITHNSIQIKYVSGLYTSNMAEKQERRKIGTAIVWIFSFPLQHGTFLTFRTVLFFQWHLVNHKMLTKCEWLQGGMGGKASWMSQHLWWQFMIKDTKCVLWKELSVVLNLFLFATSKKTNKCRKDKILENTQILCVLMI